MSYRNARRFSLILLSLLAWSALIAPGVRAAGVEFHNVPDYIAATTPLGMMKFDGACGRGWASHPQYVEGYATLRSSYTSDGRLYYFGNVCSPAFKNKSINGSDYYVSYSGFGSPQGHDPSSGSMEFTLSQKCRAAGITLASAPDGTRPNLGFKACLEFYDGATPVFATEVYSFPDFFNGNPNKRFLGAITDVPFDRVVLVSKGNDENAFVVADNFRYGYPIERQNAPIGGVIVPGQPIYGNGGNGGPVTPRRNPQGNRRTGTGRTQPAPASRRTPSAPVPPSGRTAAGEWGDRPRANLPRPSPNRPAKSKAGGGTVQPQTARRHP